MPGVGRGLQQPHAGGLHGGRLGGDSAGAAAEQLGAAQDRRGRAPHPITVPIPTDFA